MKPVEIIAIGVAIGIGGAGVLWGISIVLPALGTAIGLIIAIATTGVVSAGPIAGWAVPVAAAGVGAAGFGATYVVVVKVMKSAAKDAFSWALPALAILAGFLVEVCREFYPAAPLTKLLFALFAAFFVLIGGVLFARKDLISKFIGAGFHFAPPVTILLLIAGTSARTKMLAAFGDISIVTWIALTLMLALFGAVAYLSSQNDA